MKTTINICIDVEIAELLKKEKNVSGLINSYLVQYFGTSQNHSANLEQKRKQLAEIDFELSNKKEILVKEIQTEEHKIELSDIEKVKQMEKEKEKFEHVRQTLIDLTEMHITDEQVEDCIKQSILNDLSVFDYADRLTHKEVIYNDD